MMDTQSLTASPPSFRTREDLDDCRAVNPGESSCTGEPAPSAIRSFEGSLHFSGIVYGFSVSGLS
jgi:hypothetical protein